MIRKLSQLLFADDTVLVEDNKEKLQNLVTEFGSVCEGRKMEMNVAKIKGMSWSSSLSGAGTGFKVLLFWCRY